MANEFYDHTTYPANQAPLSSAAMRAELDLIETGFDKLPILTGNGSKVVRVNAGGDALEAVSPGTAVDIGALTNAATAKTTPVDADVIPLSDSAATWSLKKLSWANIKATLKTYFDTLYQVAGSYLTSADIGSTVQGYDANTAKYNAATANFTGTLQNGGNAVLVSTAIGTTVQAYDADTAKTDVAQTFTTSQRGTVTTDNDLSFDLNATNNFSCTPSAGGALTFTNITAGQSGFIKLVNGSNYAITAHANTKVTPTFLATISATGTYVISYWSDGANVFCATAGAMA
jgi:hypothetical protein